MKKPLVPDSEESLGLRAAWLHYVGGLTQAAVAKRLGLPSVKTHRLIARAVAEGAVKVTIDGDIVACVELESRLCARFGLNFAASPRTLPKRDCRCARWASPERSTCATC